MNKNKNILFNIKVKIRWLKYKFWKKSWESKIFGIIGREIYLLFNFILKLKIVKCFICFFLILIFLRYRITKLQSLLNGKTFFIENLKSNIDNSLVSLEYWKKINDNMNKENMSLCDTLFFNILKQTPANWMFKNSLTVLLICSSYNYIIFLSKTTIYCLLWLFFINSILLLLPDNIIQKLIYFFNIFNIMPRIITTTILLSIFYFSKNVPGAITLSPLQICVILLIWEYFLIILLISKNIKQEPYILYAKQRYSIGFIKLWTNYILPNNINELILIFPDIFYNSMSILFLFNVLKVFEENHIISSENNIILPELLNKSLDGYLFYQHCWMMLLIIILFSLSLLILLNYFCDYISKSLLSFKKKNHKIMTIKSNNNINHHTQNIKLNQKLLKYLKHNTNNENKN